MREGDEVDLTQMIEDTPAQYKARIQQHAEKTLGAAVSAAQQRASYARRLSSSMRIPTKRSSPPRNRKTAT